MKIVVEYMSKPYELQVEEGKTVLDILRTMRISPDVTIVFIDKKPIPVDTIVTEDMELKAVSVVSGG